MMNIARFAFVLVVGISLFSTTFGIDQPNNFCPFTKYWDDHTFKWDDGRLNYEKDKEMNYLLWRKKKDKKITKNYPTLFVV